MNTTTKRLAPFLTMAVGLALGACTALVPVNGMPTGGGGGGGGTTYTGTANQVVVTGSVLSTPQDIATASSVQFLSLGLGAAGGTKGQLVFAGSTSGSQTWQIPATGGTGTMTLPAAHGAAGTVLTDAAGNGTLSWAAAGGGGTTGVTGWPNAVWSTGGTFSAAAPEIMFPTDQAGYISTPTPATASAKGITITTGNGGTTHGFGGDFAVTTGGGGGASGGVGDRGGDFSVALGAGDAGTGTSRGGHVVFTPRSLNADTLNDGDFQIIFSSTDNPYYVFNDTRFYTTNVQILGKGGAGWGGLFLDYVNTATIGAVTINTPTGTANLAASASSVVITNSLVTAKSHAFACLGANDATATSIKSVVCTLHTITITTNAAATGNTPVNFVMFGAD